MKPLQWQKIWNMKRYKEILVFGFAIFGCVFGAGNLILPPMLGKLASIDWWLIALGFLLTAVVVPFLALFAFSKIEGTVLDFGKNVSRRFGIVFGMLVYVIALSLPIPRTAAVTHEIAIEPFFGNSSLLTSTVYFGLVLILAINRGKVVDFIGAFLTPIIVLLVLLFIAIGIAVPGQMLVDGTIQKAFSTGILEGYQTYDALAGIVTGSVMVVSIKALLKKDGTNNFKRVYVKSSFLAMVLLMVVYLGLIFIGAKLGSNVSESLDRTALLSYLSETVLGKYGSLILAILIALACFTTAVSVVVGASDFMKQLFNQSESAYLATTIGSCLLGILVGQMQVGAIIQIALPVLLLMYPITIVLIVLNCLPKKLSSKLMVRSTVIITAVFALPSSLQTMGISKPQELLGTLPFLQSSFPWVLPVLLTYFIVLVFKLKFIPNTTKISSNQ